LVKISSTFPPPFPYHGKGGGQNDVEKRGILDRWGDGMARKEKELIATKSTKDIKRKTRNFSGSRPHPFLLPAYAGRRWPKAG
jgi:hypothetical protein